MNQKISIIVPFYNQEDYVISVYTVLTNVLHDRAHQYNMYELIFINDGSTDNSWQRIASLATVDPLLKAINFSRNFGYQNALCAGYDYASGDAIITLSADPVHDPAHLISDMIQAWQQGSKIVYARAAGYSNASLNSVKTNLIHRFLHHISNANRNPPVSDYRLVDKVVVQTLARCSKKDRYSNTMILWTGFKHTFVDCNYFSNNASNYTKKNLSYQELGNLSLFSLKIAAFAGITICFAGFLTFIYLTITTILLQSHYSFFTWLATTISSFMGAQFILLWLIGEYIGRINQQQKNTPLYIIAESANYEQTIKTANLDLSYKTNNLSNNL